MDFGLNAMLPIFIGLYLYRKILKVNRFVLFEVVSFVELLVFANKGAIISAIFLIFLINIINFKFTAKSFFKYATLIIISIFIIINIENILKDISYILQKNNMSSYSINTMLAYFEDGNNISLNSRVGLWDSAFNMFKKNPILGNGVGSFKELYDIYTHNIFLDVLVFYGIIGLIILIILLINSLLKIKKSSYYFKITFIIFFVLWCPTLLVSSSFYSNYGFWIFIGMGLKNRKNQLE
ncbi:O-antigen ligase family protein [Clostridium baratii]